VRIGANRFTDSTGKDKAVAQIMDITEQLRIEQEKRSLEAQLIQAQKMEAIGTLAGGIAHDFNNMLMAIQSRVSVMRLHTEPEDWHHKHIAAIENTVMSAAGLTEQLLGFARKGKYKVRPTSLNDIVESSTQMFIRTRKEIKLHLDCQPELWTVEVDRGQIEQVLVNLYVNAWQAMPEGGELFVQSQNVRLNAKFCKPYGIAPGNFVKITVTDTGMGMDPATLERIFEPFFTTKDIGKGTGLGLASAYGIIKNHNGIIRAYSKKGHGATFSLYLPASVSRVAEERNAEIDLIAGEGRILLIDDDPEALQAGALMLKELGYEVVQAGGGKEAIEIYRSQGAEIAMVTLDMVMPGMGGSETFTRLKEIDPDVKVLIISGYSLNQEVQELLSNGCCGFLQKPFNIRHFSQKLKEILAPATPGGGALRAAGE
jgi:signal transduction histidine kinase/CheY-like chemotaxis protein